MKPLDGVSAIALIMIASFAIDRIVAAAMFLLTWAGIVPVSATDDRKYKFVYVLLGGALGIFVLAHFGQVRVFTALGINIDKYLDTLLTGIVLVGGADRIAGMLKAPAAPSISQPAPPPVMITGKLVLEESTAKKVLGQHARS